MKMHVLLYQDWPQQSQQCGGGFRQWGFVFDWVSLRHPALPFTGLSSVPASLHNWEFEVQLETPCHRATQVPVQPRGLCVLHIHMDTGGDKFGSPCGRMQLSTQDVASGGQAELCLAEEPE